MMGRLDSRIAFDAVAQPLIVIAGEMQVVHTDFSSDPFILQREQVGEQLQLSFSTDMQDMEACAVFFGNLDGIKRGFITGCFVPDQRVIGGGQCMAAGPELVEVSFDDGLIFAMRGNQHFTSCEDPVQRIGVIHQHITGAGPHENFDPADVFLPGIGQQGLFSIAVTNAHVKGIIRGGTACCNRIFFLQQFLCEGIGDRVRHFHKAGNTSRDCGFCFRGDRGFMGQTGFAEMHLVVDTAREQVQPMPVNFGTGCRNSGELRPDLFDPPLCYQHICIFNLPFVDDLYILYQVILHILLDKSYETAGASHLLKYYEPVKLNGGPPNKPIPMQFKQTVARLAFLLLPFSAFSQTTYLPPGDKANLLMERFEIRARSDSFFNYSKTRPFSRRHVVAAVQHYINQPGVKLSKVDAHNVRSLFANNLEWLPDTERAKYMSRKPFLKNFYKTPANLYEVHVKDFDLVVNPVFQYTLSKENNSSEKLFLNTRGVYIRGKIANKIGFYSYITDNQERDPSYVRQWVADRKAVPGHGLYKTFKTPTGLDYFEARGYFTFNVTRYIDVAFGYDRNFIGAGQRSLLLSDFGTNNLFLKLNTRIWRINYQNLFMELHSSIPPAATQLVPKKYAAMHHLDINVTKWLNIGLFEGVIFGRQNRFDFGYLNPIIFYRSIEQQNGSFDNSIIGLDFKANLPKRIQVYGQVMLDEFLLSEVKANNGWWANKFGFQLGAKYIDAFNVSNLDLQLEHNRVRPFSYSHYDSVANYTHYNQPLAHPLMAGFSETIGVARYQPAPKWLLVGKLIYWKQGRDSSSRSFGSNIFLPNVAPYRQGDYGYNIGSGWATQVLYGSFLVSFEFRENFFAEISAVVRREKTTTAPIVKNNVSVISFGLRWNMQRREFEF